MAFSPPKGVGITTLSDLRKQTPAGFTFPKKEKKPSIVKSILGKVLSTFITPPTTPIQPKIAKQITTSIKTAPERLSALKRDPTGAIKFDPEKAFSLGSGFLPVGLARGVPKVAAKAVKPVVKTSIDILDDLLQQAKPLRGKLQKAFTAERSRRAVQVEKAITEIGGEKGYVKALSSLKGPLATKEAKIAFEPIKAKLPKAAIDDLYNQTFKHPYLDQFEKISTADGLTKILSGELPQPKQLLLMEEVYGTNIIKNLLSKRALGLKVKDVLVEIANIPRAVLATADMSAFLRQGMVEVAAHPVISAKAAAKTFQFAFSPKAFAQYFKDLPKDPLYKLIRDSKLAITDPSRALAPGREEAFISRVLQKTPGIGEIVKFSERSYTGFLSKLRVDIFKNWADDLLSKGFSPVNDAKTFKAAADVVNTFTGRGGLGKLDRIAPELNTLFFSPRLIAARFQAMNPIWYARMWRNPQTRPVAKKALGDMAKFVTAGMSTLGIIKAYKKANNLSDKELSVEPDPISSDFGKIKIGNTRWDIWAGFQQWARVFAQVSSGKRKNTTTGEIVSLNKDEYPFTTRKEVLLRFIEGKLAPVPALVNELISGAKTFEGEPITPETVAREKFIPMYLQDIGEAFKEGGLGRAVGAGVPAFLGIGVQTYKQRPKKQRGGGSPFIPSGGGGQSPFLPR